MEVEAEVVVVEEVVSFADSLVIKKLIALKQDLVEIEDMAEIEAEEGVVVLVEDVVALVEVEARRRLQEE